MKLRDLYNRAIATGTENDPRGKDSVVADIEARKKNYTLMKDDEREFFDQETLQNPYSDSRILNGTGEEEIKSALVGVDIEVGEVLLCDSLNARGKGIDLIIAHHPEGKAYAKLFDVMRIQADILHRFGVSISTAEDLMDSRIKEVERKLMPVNHTRAVDAARLMDIPFLCLHTPADNMVATYLQRLFDEKKPHTVSDIMDILKAIPEYREGAINGSGPNILIGSKARKAGRIFVDMTGGTEGSKEIFEGLASSGINTVVAMHLSEDHRKEAEKNHLNVVIAGHIASDNLGINLLLDEIIKAEPAFIIHDCSGFKRVSR